MHAAPLTGDLASHGQLDALKTAADERRDAPWRVWLDHPHAPSTSRIEPFHHNFHDHPLMELPRLARLAQSLWPQGQCRFMAPEARDASPFESVIRLRSPDGRRIDEVFRHLDVPGTWVA
jgi:hypothetical protein